LVLQFRVYIVKILIGQFWVFYICTFNKIKTHLVSNNYGRVEDSN
jgi:hypothetical protein